MVKWHTTQAKREAEMEPRASAVGRSGHCQGSLWELRDCGEKLRHRPERRGHRAGTLG